MSDQPKIETRGRKKGPHREARSYLLKPATIALIDDMAHAARCSRNAAIEELVDAGAALYIQRKLKEAS